MLSRFLLPVITFMTMTLLAGCPLPNTPPTADAGPDQTVQLGDTVTLDGSRSSDPENGSLSYQWQFVSQPEGSRAVLSSPGTTAPSFTPDRPGTYVLSLKVIDSQGSNDSDTVSILVEGDLVTVPDLAGVTQAQVEVALTALGLRIGNITTEASATIPAGQVIRQNPEANEETIPGGTVDLVISAGPDRVLVPDVAGQTRESATAAITAAGLVATLTFENSDTVEVNLVISQDPAAATEVDEGSEVGLVISLGPATRNQVAVPDVLGRNQVEAQTMIEAANLLVDSITFEHSDSVEAGLVLFQAPFAGTIVDIGSEVDLVISLGPESGGSVAVPDLAGLTRAAATTAIETEGLTLGSVTETSSTTVAAGIVISSDPEAGTVVDAGTAINLVVSSGPPQVSVPDLAGQTQAEAGQTLEAEGLVLGTVTQAPDDEAEPGTIIGQDPAANTSVNTGSAVNITVAVGPIDIQLDASANLRDALGETVPENVLRPDAVVADSTTGEIYIAARLTPHIAVFNTTQSVVTGTMNAGFPLPGEKRLFLAPGDTALYVLNITTSVLNRIDRATGEVTATTTLDDSFVDLLVDTARDQVYVIRRNSPSFLYLNAGSLAQESTSTSLDGVTGEMVFEKSGASLLVMNFERFEGDGQLRTFNPATGTVTNTLVFDMPGGGASSPLQFIYDGDNDRFFVRIIAALGSQGIDGGNPRTMNIPSQNTGIDMVYDPTSGRLVVLALDKPVGDEVSPRGASLLTFNPNIGQDTSPQETIDLGEHNAHLAIDTSTNTLLSPDHSTGTVWTAGTSPFPDTASAFALGSNIDQIAVAGDRVFGNSRFGNSTLFYLAPATGAFVHFEAGTWPAPLTVAPDASGSPVLSVVNAWDTTVSRFATDSTPTHLDTFALDVPKGTTERLPDVASSPAGDQVAVAYPEFGTVAILDTTDGASIATLNIPNTTTGTEPAGKGQLQVLFDQNDGSLLFVYDRMAALLHTFDATDSFAALEVVDLSGDLPDMDDAPETGWLFHDAENSLLFVGPVRVDPATRTIAAGQVPDSQIVLAIDTVFDCYWTAEQVQTETGLTVTLRALHRSDFSAAGDSLTLPGSHPIAPEFAFDTVNRRFHVAYPDTTDIETYTY